MAFVQSNGIWDDSGDTQSSFGLAFGSNVTAGNVMIAACRFHVDLTPTVADTRGSTWTLGGRYWNAGEEMGAVWYWAVVPSSGANTVTFSFTTPNAQVRIALHEESGIDTASPIDGSNGSSAFFTDTATDGASSGTFTPTEANARIIGIALVNPSATPTAGTNFTLHHGSTSTRTWIESRTLAVPASTAATFTIPGSMLAIIMGIALKPAGGGGSSTTVTPTAGALTVAGRAPSVNSFTNVRYQEVLINSAGSPVGNRTGLRLTVWYSGQCSGAPDLSYSDMTTGAAGTASYSIATGSLVFGQKAFGVITDGGESLSSYTCGLLTFTYS
jgi:hypothetical protein